MVTSVLTNFEKHPDVAKASHMGDPTLIDPAPVTATDVVKQVSRSASGDNSLSVETTGGAVTPNQPAPRSDAPPTTGDAASGTAPAESGAASDPAAAAESKAGSADPNELKPNVDADPNALPPLQQSNQLDTSNGTTASSSSTSGKNEELADISSSKKKKKKGIGKLNPF
jgi:outer membrane protein assembly factor BamD